MGKGTKPPDLTYLAYWSIVPGPVQFILLLDIERLELRFLDIDPELKLIAVVRPEISWLLHVETFFGFLVSED